MPTHAHEICWQTELSSSMGNGFAKLLLSRSCLRVEIPSIGWHSHKLLGHALAMERMRWIECYRFRRNGACADSARTTLRILFTHYLSATICRCNKSDQHSSKNYLPHTWIDCKYHRGHLAVAVLENETEARRMSGRKRRKGLYT
jgi:hypothetical protein